jgi:hypothetical protein
METVQQQPPPPIWEGGPPKGALPAPSAVFLTGEEFMRASFMANVANLIVTITGRILRPDNTISRINFSLTPAGNRTLTTAVVGLSSGWLLDLTARVTTGAPAFGAVWGMFELGVGAGSLFSVTETMRAGFCTANTPLSYASSVSMLPLDGPGCLRSITGTTPGAGVDVTETVPTNARWELLAFNAKFITSAAVANRVPAFVLDDGTNTYYRGGYITNQAASISERYGIYQGGAAALLDNDSNQNRGLPVGLRMGAGHRIRTTTFAIDVADQWSQVQYLAREWMTGE